MADTANLGNALQQSFVAQQLGSEQYKKLLGAQQQKALYDALLQQGTTPLDTNNRSIGGVGYRISPLEGVAKLAQALTGAYGETQANSKLADALSPQPGSQQSSAVDPIVASMPAPTQATYNHLMLPESMGGNPRAGMELYGTYAAGLKSYGAGTGTAAAGMAPAGTLPPGVGGPAQSQQMAPAPTQGVPQSQSVPNGTPAPISPVQPAPLPPIGGTPDPQQVAALSAYRQQNGMPTPPIDGQRAAMGLPVGVGSNIPMPPPSGAITPSPTDPAAVPPIAASALTPPPTTPAPVAAMPTPNAGESNDAYQARLEAAKAGAVAQAGVVPAGQTKAAETTGENSAEAAKTLNVMMQNLPILQKRISDMTAANQASTFGPWNDKEGNGLASSYQDLQNSPASTSNARLQQLTAQNVLPEVAPNLNGLKGNKFLETLSSTASGVDLSKGQAARQTQIDGLQQNYIQNLKSTYNQVKQYGGDPSTVFADPPSVANAVKLGIIPREEGINILQQKHGMQ